MTRATALGFAEPAELLAFRQAVRDLIARHAPPASGQWPTQRPDWERPDSEVYANWRDQLARRGWIAPSWPTRFGGGGLSVVEQFALSEELARARVTHPTEGVGVNIVGPSIIKFGTEEQQARYLPKIMDGSEVWCQGFSEPDAGSDLGSLKTMAQPVPGGYLVNGSKIWTSLAHRSKWILLLARSNPDAPKHGGLTMLLVPVGSAGVEIRPLAQMNGAQDFNQVFFTNVTVPEDFRLGPESEGWRVATSTLDIERSSVMLTVGCITMAEDLVAYIRWRDDRTQTAAWRMRVAEHSIESQVAYLLSRRVVLLQSAGESPNAEASAAKLFGSELQQRIAGTSLSVAGLAGQLLDTDRQQAAQGAFAFNYLDATSYTVGGGTSEIQRNIIAQRGLSLPRD